MTCKTNNETCLKMNGQLPFAWESPKHGRRHSEPSRMGLSSEPAAAMKLEARRTIHGRHDIGGFEDHSAGHLHSVDVQTIYAAPVNISVRIVEKSAQGGMKISVQWRQDKTTQRIVEETNGGGMVISVQLPDDAPRRSQSTALILQEATPSCSLTSASFHSPPSRSHAPTTRVSRHSSPIFLQAGPSPYSPPSSAEAPKGTRFSQRDNTQLPPTPHPGTSKRPQRHDSSHGVLLQLTNLSSDELSPVGIPCECDASPKLSQRSPNVSNFYSPSLPSGILRVSKDMQSPMSDGYVSMATEGEVMHSRMPSR